MPYYGMQGGGSTIGGALPTPTLSNQSFVFGSLAGDPIGQIQNLTVGSILTVVPTNNQVVVDGQNFLRVGMVPSQVGSFTFTLVQTLSGFTNSPQSTTFTITVTARPPAVLLVNNVRMPLMSVVEIVPPNTGVPTTNADTTALAASSTNKTKPSVTVTAGATRQFAFKLPAQPSGTLINYIASTDANPAGNYAFDYSDTSTNGQDGTFTSVTSLNYTPLPGTPSNGPRGALNPYPAGPSGRYVRFTITNGGAGALTCLIGMFDGSSNDNTGLIGDSITIGDFDVVSFETYIKYLDPRRDPNVTNSGQFGFSTVNMRVTEVPIYAAAVAAGVNFGAIFFGSSVNDISSAARPEATDPNAGAVATNAGLLLDAIIAAGIPENRTFFCDISWSYFLGHVAPLVTIADAANGSPPYNVLLYQWMKTRAMSATVSTALDVPMIQHSGPTTNECEDIFVDNTTHPMGPGYPEQFYRQSPAVKFLSGLPIGQSYVEELIVENYLAGVTTTHAKQRLTDMMNLFASPTTVASTALRQQAATMIASMVTNPASYADPVGVVLPPSRPGVTLVSWFDAAYLPNLSLLNDTSVRLRRITDRSSNAFTATVVNDPFGMIFQMPSHANNRGMLRGVNSNQALTLVTGGSGYTNGSYTSIPLTGGFGAGALANITVAGGAVTVCTPISGSVGVGYHLNDLLSASVIGPGTGFTYLVQRITQLGGIASPGVGGYMVADQAGWYTQFDLQQSFSWELYGRTWGVGSASGAFFGTTNMFVELTGVSGPLRWFMTGIGSITSSIATPYGQPFYAAGTYNQPIHTSTLYVNGAVVATSATVKPLYTSTAGALMGRAGGTTKCSDDEFEVTTYQGILTDISTTGRQYGQTKWGCP